VGENYKQNKDRLIKLKRKYSLGYRSNIQWTDEHCVKVRVKTEGLRFTDVNDKRYPVSRPPPPFFYCCAG
jgi:hypothetical protein